ncbi:MAG TPA: YraN family protein [Pseudomonadales bacterium]
MSTLSRLLGRQQEKRAENYLQAQGLATITRNYQCRQGEIDLIMRDKDTLVFVEVRYRSNNRHGSAAESVDQRKQQKILHTARHFLASHGEFQQMYCRFDVLAIDQANPSPFNWLKNAFVE